MTTAVRNPTQVPVAQPIAQRWSPRAFDPMFDLSAEDITALGEAARWAPSAANLQPTRFIVARRGTAPASGAGASGEEDTAVFVPLTAALERFSPLIQVRSSGSRTNERVVLHQLVMEVGDVEQVPAAAGALRSLLGKRHPKQDVRITVPLELLEEAARTKRLFTLILASIAGISLLVGGVGIMNIMLANVTERTREIGVRRALGARRRDIVGQFLAETLLLSGIGGALGIGLGVALPALITKFTDMATVVTVPSLVLAFGVSAGVGIVFGLYPASRAADLDPVEALRHA